MEAWQDTAPALAWYSRRIVLDGIWQRPNLSRYDRSIITISSLVAGGHGADLKDILEAGLDHGITPGVIAELCTHLAFVTGFPHAIAAVEQLRRVLEKRGIELTVDQAAAGKNIVADTLVLPPITAIKQSYRPNPFSVALQEGIEIIVDQDLVQRKGMGERERCLADLSAAISSGQNAQIMPCARRAMDAGTTLPELCEAVLHLAYYAGLLKAQTAASILDPLGAIARV